MVYAETDSGGCLPKHTFMVKRKAAFVRRFRTKSFLTVHQENADISKQKSPRGISRGDKNMVSKPPAWTILDNNLPQEPQSCAKSYPVHHSFGRGSFRHVAEKVVVPKMVLDQIIGNKYWTEMPRGHPVSAKLVVGVAGGAKMGGVNLSMKPKSSGRARALHLRAEKAAKSLRKPVRLCDMFYYTVIEKWVGLGKQTPPIFLMHNGGCHCSYAD